MNTHSSKKQATPHNLHSWDQTQSAGSFGLALRPPAYGIDAIDQGLTEALASPETVTQRQADVADTGGDTGVPSENKTGLPDNLKAGIESLSGLALDDVRVHYNSDKPAQLQALAYTRGTEIYVARGQEKHLPHEAWHVVQQAQGRVQPTMQFAGAQINDDPGLEHEADVMGAKAEEIRKMLAQGVSEEGNPEKTRLYFQFSTAHPKGEKVKDEQAGATKYNFAGSPRNAQRQIACRRQVSHQRVIQRLYGYEFETLIPVTAETRRLAGQNVDEDPSGKRTKEEETHHPRLYYERGNKWDAVEDGNHVELRTLKGLTVTELHLVAVEIDMFLKQIVAGELAGFQLNNGEEWRTRGKPQLTVGIRPRAVDKFLSWLRKNEMLGKMYELAAKDVPAELPLIDSKEREVLDVEKGKKGLLEGSEVSKAQRLKQARTKVLPAVNTMPKGCEEPSEALLGLAAIVYSYAANAASLITSKKKSNEGDIIGITLKSILGPVISRSDLHVWYLAILKELVPGEKSEVWNNKIKDSFIPALLKILIESRPESSEKPEHTFLGESPGAWVDYDVDEDKSEDLSLQAWLNYIFHPGPFDDSANKVVPPMSAGAADRLSLGKLGVEEPTSNDKALVKFELRGLRNVVIAHRLWAWYMLQLADHIDDEQWGDY